VARERAGPSSPPLPSSSPPDYPKVFCSVLRTGPSPPAPPGPATLDRVIKYVSYAETLCLSSGGKVSYRPFPFLPGGDEEIPQHDDFFQTPPLLSSDMLRCLS